MAAQKNTLSWIWICSSAFPRGWTSPLRSEILARRSNEKRNEMPAWFPSTLRFDHGFATTVRPCPERQAGSAYHILTYSTYLLYSSTKPAASSLAEPRPSLSSSSSSSSSSSASSSPSSFFSKKKNTKAVHSWPSSCPHASRSQWTVQK
ncbi:hypothetical protein FN846DRAFT_932258 [Sphaerosporella brunnea]|uniref:Uncharacterized protein n=1 Tax=Sphaerosporella brunnea TaxID=1250544 RepID=A0A5J5F7K6_9PEZI|nr:hypothetical protein FN846DRAFT_932258 [Sphaerosporella brunnea]